MASLTLKQTAFVATGDGSQLAFSPDGAWLVAAAPNRVQLWRGDELVTTLPLASPATSLPQFNSTGDYLFIGLEAVEMATLTPLNLPPVASAVVEGLNAPPNAFEIEGVAWSAEGDTLLIYAHYRPPRLIGAGLPYHGPQKRLVELDGMRRTLRRVLWEESTAQEYPCLAVGEALFAAGGLPVSLWERRTGQYLGEWAAHATQPRDLRFERAGRVLVSAGWDGQVVVLETRTQDEVARWVAHANYARAAAFHPQLPLLASGGGDHWLKVWEIGAERPAALLEMPDNIEGVAFHPAGERLVAALQRGGLVWAALA